MVRILTQEEYDELVEDLAADAYLSICDNERVDETSANDLQEHIGTVRKEIVDAVEYSGEFGELGWVETVESPSMAFYGSIIDNRNGAYLHSELQKLVDCRLRDKFLTKKEAMRYLVADVKEATNDRLRERFKDDE